MIEMVLKSSGERTNYLIDDTGKTWSLHGKNNVELMPYTGWVDRRLIYKRIYIFIILRYYELFVCIGNMHT